jgi:erythromycin esterase-like protein
MRPSGEPGAAAELVRRSAMPLTGSPTDYDPLMELIGEAPFVLLGEASHGTHDFYRERAAITRRLIEEKEFNAVIVEADWPDAYRVNCFVRSAGDADEAIDSLAGFERFPTWMWRNADVLDFIGWLREFNEDQAAADRVGFYGMDLYSMYSSIDAVLGYLEKVDPEAARQARARYGCFDHFGEDSQAYGYATSIGMARSCADAVVEQLVDLRRRAADYANRDGWIAQDEFFYAEQNARLVKNAEEYYRSMFGGRVSTWNLRDRHMVETLNALVGHLGRSGRRAKVAVWAHNSHLGDARATEMGQRGELNVGQLVREQYGRDAVLVGFSTYTGTVTAADDWGQPALRKKVRPGIAGSYEELFHAAGAADFLLRLRDDGALAAELSQPRLERAIGVIYRPETERWSHYFHANLPAQFDAVLHFDVTRAVEPLDRSQHWERGEAPETYPVGL